MASLRRAFASYERALHSHPLATKARFRHSSSAVPSQRIHFVRLLQGRRVCRFASQATTSACVSCVGDLTCQVLDDSGAESIDLKRLAIFTGLGGLMVGPTLHTWYSFLHRRIPGDSGFVLAKRLALDQLVFAPIFIPTFMLALLSAEGHAQPTEHVQRAWWPAVMSNWKLWVPAQAINFTLVPPHFRKLSHREPEPGTSWQLTSHFRSLVDPTEVLFANGVAVGWNAYLSWASHAPPTDERQRRKDET